MFENKRLRKNNEIILIDYFNGDFTQDLYNIII